MCAFERERVAQTGCGGSSKSHSLEVIFSNGRSIGINGCGLQGEWGGKGWRAKRSREPERARRGGERESMRESMREESEDFCFPTQ